MLRWVFLCICLMLTSLLYGQSSTNVLGLVTDASGGKMCGVSVIACDEKGNPLHATISDAEGCFRLRKDPRTAYVQFGFLGYKPQIVKYESFKNDLKVVMTETAFHLREVTVKAERIRAEGDTLSFSVAGFRQMQDRSIADVIRKMPGLEVRPDGSIAYQGKAINRFYIEGMDMLGGRYAQASNNVSADKIKEVQVLENHQTIKSLRGVKFSEQAALNIVLKDDARAVWSGVADVGAGYADKENDFLYENRLMGMNFRRNFQTLLLCKNTDTGTNIVDEVLDMASVGEYRGESGLVGMSDLGGLAFEKDRYTFHKSLLGSGNWLWKTGRDSELRLQLGGLREREDQWRLGATTYFDLEDAPSVAEQWAVETCRREAQGEITYTLNKEKIYLRSTSKLNGEWNESRGAITYNDRMTDLMIRPHRRFLSEDLTLLHTTQRGDVIEAKSSVGFTRLPGFLRTINDDLQTLNLDLFSVKNRVQYTRMWGRWSFANAVGLDCRNQRINHTHWSLERLYWTPAVSVRGKRHELKTGVRLSYAHQSLDGCHTSNLWAEPSLNWRWTLSPTSKFMADYQMSAEPYEGKMLTSEPLFTSYAQRRVGIGSPATRYTHTLTGAFTFRNTLYGIFLYLRPTYLHSRDNILYAGRMEEGIYTQEAVNRRYATNVWRLDGRIAKNFFWAYATVGLGVGVNSVESQMMMVRRLARNRLCSVRLALDYALKPFSGLAVEGKSTLSINRRTERTPPYGKSHTSDWAHRLALNYNPAGGWLFRFNQELYHSSEKSFGVNYFCDVAVGYKAARWEVTLRANNLADTSSYERIEVGETMRTYTMTRLRPREFLFKISLDL